MHTLQTTIGAPSLKKRALSLYFRVGCERQLLLYLYDDKSRAAQQMPPRQGGRAGLGLVGKHGFEHQGQKVSELRTAFGDPLIIAGADTKTPGRTSPVALLSALTSAVQPYSVIVEAEYDGGTPRAMTALGLDTIRDSNGNAIGIGDLAPDLIQVLPPLATHIQDNPGLSPALREQIHADGTRTPIDAVSDKRIRLRVIDVKLASEPGAHYFAETVFYSMTLAAWLQEQGLDQQFTVVAAPAVLPGSLDGSELGAAITEAVKTGTKLSLAQAAAAFDGDLEVAPVEAFAPRILQLARDVIPRLLATPWNQVEIHVDYRCAGCEFLGDPHIMSKGELTQHPRHCWPLAEGAQHLSRIFGLSRGGSLTLRENSVQTTSELAVGAQPAAFSKHHGLKAKQTVFPARASSLHTQSAGVIANSGSDALMPRWPNLHINLFIDYDPATAFTIALGCRAFWVEPIPFGSQIEKHKKSWGRTQGDTEVFLVDEPTIDAERREFLRFLTFLREILKWVRDQDEEDVKNGRRDGKTRRSTYQIYLWDEAQRRHFIRGCQKFCVWGIA